MSNFDTTYAEAMALSEELRLTLDTWELVCYDRGRLAFDLDIYEQPEVGGVYDVTVRILEIKSIDIPGKVCHAEIEYVFDKPELIDLLEQ